MRNIDYTPAETELLNLHIETMTSVKNKLEALMPTHAGWFAKNVITHEVDLTACEVAVLEDHCGGSFIEWTGIDATLFHVFTAICHWLKYPHLY